MTTTVSGTDAMNVGALPRRFRAPGRINIIGEHTDYNDGFVLPTNTALYTTVEATRRQDDLVRVNTHTLNVAGEFRIGQYSGNEMPQWLRYVAGVAAELECRGAKLTGADLVIAGNIPIGSGLSSSASLELAVARALTALAGIAFTAEELARMCQRAERDFAGVDCGVMDQYSVACGNRGSAMLLDCRSLQAEFVALPANLSLVVTDSGVAHCHRESGYNERADECRAAVRALRDTGIDIQSLRDVSMDALESARQALGDLLYRRARHVVTENARTIAACTALNDGDINGLGELIAESHASLRDDFEVSCDGIEVLVDLASRCGGVVGARMVGGGFGGCVLSVVDKEATESVVKKIRIDYGKAIGINPWIHVVAPADAAEEIEA